MEEHRRTRFGSRGLILEPAGASGSSVSAASGASTGASSGTASASASAAASAARTLDFFTAEIHYWRLPRSAWSACLDAIRHLGFELISTYVPWSVHEQPAGHLDWTGARDLPAFLAAAAAADLRVVLKPGPHINAELTHWGYPERVLRDPAMQAVTARGTPVWMPAPPHMFPVPSYASAAFREAASAWLAGFGEIARPHLHPAGPVVALQVDNEAQMFFRLGAFDHDYHPDAVAWWHEDAPALGLPADPPPPPPRAWDPADPAPAIAWVRFKERYTERALAWVAAALDAAGLGAAARYHNAPPSQPHLCHLPGAARAAGGPAGLDFYHRARDLAQVRRRADYLAGSAHPLPIAAEIGVGGPPWLPPMTADDQADVTRAILAGGARGLCFFMVVDRDRWYGAPVSTTGQLRAPGPWLATLLTALREIDWTALRRHTAVAVVMSRAETRIGVAASAADPLSPVVTELLGLGGDRTGAATLSRDPGPARHRRWTEAVLGALDRAGVPYALIDEDAGDDAFAAHDVLIAPTLARIDRALLARLRAAAARGARVVIGPERPTRDELDRPLGPADTLPRRYGLVRPGSLEDPDGLAQDLRDIAGEAARGPVWLEGASTEWPDQSTWLCLFADAAGHPRAVFTGNAGPSPARVRLAADRALAIRDPWTGAHLDLNPAAPAELELPPHSVRMWVADAGPAAD